MSGPSYDYVVYVDSDTDLILDNGEEVLTKVFSADYKGVDFDIFRGGGISVDLTANNSPNLPSIGFLPHGLAMDGTGSRLGGKAFLRNSRNTTAEVLVSAEGDIGVQ